MAVKRTRTHGRKALGRGLSALLPEPEPAPRRADDDASSGVSRREVALSSVHPSPQQPRTRFDEQALAELAETIGSLGVLQPLLVRRVKGGYELVSGERRWRAARQAGLDRVPVEVLEIDEEQARIIALVENLQREDLSLLEEAEAYRRLVEEHAMTQEAVAKRVGKDRSTVANALRLLQLPAAVREQVLRGDLSAGHARALLGLPEAQLVQVAEQVARKGMTVRATEKLARRLREADPSPATRKRPTRSAEAQALEQELCRSLGTRVRLRETKKGQGRIEIAYHSYRELERLLDLMSH